MVPMVLYISNYLKYIIEVKKGMVRVVRCTICHKITRIRSNFTQFFRCCGVLHEIAPNIVFEKTWGTPISCGKTENDKPITSDEIDEIQIV